MDLSSIINRAIHNVQTHRRLWWVGFIWALAGGGGGGSAGSGNAGLSFDSPGPNRRPDVFDRVDVEQLLAVLAVAIPFIVLLVVVMTVVNYVLRSGSYQGLELIESQRWNPTVRGVWRLGWQRRTWRLLAGDLVVGIPLAIAIVLGLLLALSPLILLVADSAPLSVLAILMTVVTFLLWLGLTIAVSVVVGIASKLWARAAVVDDLSIVPALSAGFGATRLNLWTLIKATVVMFVLSIVYAVATVVAVLFAVAIALLVAGLPAYLFHQATGNLAGALLYAIPVGVLIVAVPAGFLQGLWLMFDTDVWSLIYRELPRRGGLPAVQSTPPAPTTDVA
jgi:hypothetical protein